MDRLREGAGNLQAYLEKIVGPHLQPVAVRVQPYVTTGRFVAVGSLELYDLVDLETKKAGVEFLISQLVWTLCQLLYYMRYSSLLSALESKVAADLYRELLIQSALHAVCSSAWSYQTLCANNFTLRLRRSLTSELVERYLTRRLYYNRQGLNISPHALGTDVKKFADNLLSATSKILFPAIRVAILANFVAPVTLKVGVLLALYGVYMLCAIIYVRVDFATLSVRSVETQKAFEDALRRVEDAAEQLAFYRGEEVERVRILRKADAAIRASSRFLSEKFKDDLFQLVNCDLVLLSPLVIFSPEYFSGKIDIAGMMYIKHMFYNVYAAITVLPVQLDICKSLYLSFVSLTRITQARQHKPLPRTAPRQVEGEIPLLHIQGLGVQYPQRDPTFQNAKFTVNRGQYVYVEGGNGAGKTTLFRVCSRLLDQGTTTVGEFFSIDEERILFVPQKPYILASASLRDQILFPRWRKSTANRPSDEDLRTLMKKLTLWEKVVVGNDDDEATVLEETLSNKQFKLSGGEEQLVGFARLMLAVRALAKTNADNRTDEPVLVFLDEATSQLFPKTERLVYELLQSECDTFVSISHRDSLRNFHNVFRTIPEDLEE